MLSYNWLFLPGPDHVGHQKMMEDRVRLSHKLKWARKRGLSVLMATSEKVGKAWQKVWVTMTYEANTKTHSRDT